MIKAIDAQQVIIQIEHAARVQQQHPEVQQRFLQVQTQEEKKLLREKVKNAEETNQARIGEDENRERRRNEGGHGEKGGKEAMDPGEEASQKVPSQAGHIHITV